MKHIVIFSLIAFFSLCTFSSCRIERVNDNGPKATRRVNVTGFTGVTLLVPVDVVYVPADTFSVTMTGTKELVDRIEVSTHNGILQIKERKQGDRHIIEIGGGNRNATIRITAPSLQDIKVVGSGSFSCDTLRSLSALSFVVMGSGDIDVKHIEGGQVSATVTGSGEIKAGLAKVQSTDASVTGSGEIEMKFKQCGKVNGQITGSGEIAFSGDVQSLQKSVTGSGLFLTDDLNVSH